MKDFKKIIENVVANSQLDALPPEIQPGRIFTWNNDLSSQKDWDDFTGGQLVAHTYWTKKNHKVWIDTASLQFGTSATSFWGMLTANEQITLYTSEYIDLTGQFVTIGTNVDQKYYALSYELQGFEIGEDKKKKRFYGKIVLVNIQKFLDNQFNDENEAPIINIANGKLNETITIPAFKARVKGQTADPNVKHITEKQVINKKMRRVEILFPKPTIMLGGIDFVANLDRDGDALADQNRLIAPSEASTEPKTLPKNPYYCIVPIQFNVPSIDNFGWTHPADRSNVIKTLMATQAIGSATQTGVGLAGSGGFLGSFASGIASGVIGLGQKFFGDKGTLANSTAVNASFLSGEGDPIKMFIQGDGAKTGSKLNRSGYLQITDLEAQGDYLEVNQANGQFGKYGKSMSPSQNHQFNELTDWRALGLSSIALANGATEIPALASPFASSRYSNLIINDKKKQDYMLTGAMRKRISSGDILKPMVFPESWDVYIRNMFFRPDPYSFWNWPAMMPAEIGIWDVEKKTDIAYDITSQGSALELLNVPNTQNNADTKKLSYWNKTILVSQITDNDLYDPNKTYSSYRYKFDEGATNLGDFYQIQFTAITSSTATVNILDENDEIIRTHKFNTQGLNVGTSASWGTVLQI